MESTNQPKEDIKVKKPVKFKSNQTQRTDIETYKKPEMQAPLKASFNSGGQQGKSKKKKSNKKKQNVVENGIYKKEDTREELLLPGFGSTASRPMIPAYVQQQMPDGVRLGNITALNTDQHRFYSFNQRLLSRFVPLWGSRVRSALYKWLKKNNPPSISKSWVTNVEVIMNEKGEVLDVQPFRLSGLWDIDQASIQSFKDVENVPNPPKEMIDENGYIHLQFQTEVLWIPQPGVKFQSNN